MTLEDLQKVRDLRTYPKYGILLTLVGAACRRRAEQSALFQQRGWRGSLARYTPCFQDSVTGAGRRHIHRGGPVGRYVRNT